MKNSCASCEVVREAFLAFVDPFGLLLVDLAMIRVDQLRGRGEREPLQLCFLRFTLTQSNSNVPYKWLVRTLPNLLYVHEQEFPSLLVLSFSTSSSFSNSVNIQFSPNFNPSETTSSYTRRTGEEEEEYDLSQEENGG